MIETLQGILRERSAAAQGELPRDLTPALDIATNPKGVTFDGLQRARSTLGERIDFEQKQGFDAGDLKRAYGALSEAMQTAVQQSARVEPDTALGLFRTAEARFGQLAEQNRDLTQVAGSGSEALVNRLIGYGSELTQGNVSRLRELQAVIPEEQRTGLSRIAFQRLGDNAGSFDLDRFAQQWSKLSQPGRQALFGDRVQRIDQTLQSALSTTSTTRAANADIVRLLGASDEGLARRVVSLASSGASADSAMLARLNAVVGPDGMKNVSSLAIQNLGANRAGEFSPAFFSSNWQKMSDAGKALLFPDKTLRSSLNDIAAVSARMAEVERKFANKSNTGRVVVGTSMVGALMHEPMTFLATVMGGQVLGRVLSRPASAASASKFSIAYERYVKSPSAGAGAALKQATTNLSNTVAGDLAAPLTGQAVIQEIRRLSSD